MNSEVNSVENKETVRTHRVGTITCGCTLIIYGVLFLLHFFVKAVTLKFVLSLWPIVLIGMGVEILISSRKNSKLVYDTGAIVVIIVTAVLTSVLAVMSVVAEAFALHFTDILF